MIRAFFAAGVIEVVILFFAAAFTAGITEKMSTSQAGTGLLVFGAVDCVTIALSVWIYRALGATWGGASPPLWSVILFGVLATLTGVMMLIAAMVLLNR